MERKAELAEIAAFVQNRGVTHLPPGYSGKVRAALPLVEERARVDRFRPVMLTREQAFQALKARIVGRR